MTEQEKNIVQVYGIPRSGTNFVEWSLVNNFVNLEYKNIYIDLPANKLLFKTNIVKHQYPSFDYSDYVVVIYKKFENSQKSYSKWSGRREPLSRELYDEYLLKARTLSPRKTIIFEHSWLVDNYQKGMEQISNKFDLKLKDQITQPLNRMNKAGALAQQTHRRYQR